mmetsp:Transcript_18885/g.57382  ORF Transcript_18885/g.57382 Transcript_18885/m.57382 type:complete len:653 (-) Transcript_18885:183-2141(-)
MSAPSPLRGPLRAGRDPSSAAEPQVAYATHLDLDWHVDFAARAIRGVATWTMVARGNRAVFDLRNVQVHQVAVDGNSCQWAVQEHHAELGQKLVVSLSPAEKTEVRITYTTSPDAMALQWLEPSMTDGKERPYVFTQCQAIHARSLVPCQDSPGIKFTYEARVAVPNWATALMSALPNGDAVEDGTQVFYFRQPMPISSYLLALVVGDLAPRDLSPRVRVWSEPGVVGKAAFEFAETEQFLQYAEELTGIDYPWGRYDIVCMPPSFPYGGMENPCLTFVTPTLLAGDRSLAGVVAHEISHSWTGNLVTNHTWEHFWLNEGWTVWFERKIKARQAGNDLYYDFNAHVEYPGLRDTVELFVEQGRPEFTSMVPLLGAADPDDAFSRIPYEKGSALLYVLERRVGRDAFMAFAKDYMKEFAGKTIDTQKFHEFFVSKFPAVGGDFDWEAWWGPGMPPEDPKYDDSLVTDALELADFCLTCEDDAEATAEVADRVEAKWTDWDAAQQQVFLEGLLQSKSGAALKASVTEQLQERLGLAEAQNSEIKSRWCYCCLRAGNTDIVDTAIAMATSVGRMKFVRPLYRELNKVDAARDKAKEAFKKNKSNYHPICARLVAKDLGLEGDEKKPGLTTKQIAVAAAVVAAAAAVGFIVLRRRS